MVNNVAVCVKEYIDARQNVAVAWGLRLEAWGLRLEPFQYFSQRFNFVTGLLYYLTSQRQTVCVLAAAARWLIPDLLSNLALRSIANTLPRDQGSVGDCGLFRYRQFERVSEIPGIQANHTVPTLFPDRCVPGCELIPDPSTVRARPEWPMDQGSGAFYGAHQRRMTLFKRD